MELVIVGLLALVVGLLLGILGNGRVATDRAWRQKSEFDTERARLEAELQSARDRLLELDGAVAAKITAEAAIADLRATAARDVAALQSKADAQTSEIDRLRGELKSIDLKLGLSRDETTSLRETLAGRDAQEKAQHAAAEEKLNFLMKAKEELSDQFKALATNILEERAQKFGEDSAKAIGTLLDPVKTKLGEFQTKVEGFQQQHETTAAALGNELKHLGEVSRGMTEEASRLTRALTTQSQVRGAWGEQVLRRVLEVAGLREGMDFVVQEVHRREDGTLPRPDVVVNLPGERRIVVDAKLSLIDYVACTAANDETDRAAALRRHVAAVRQHIRDLSDKDYTKLLGTGTLDFVIAFVPIEQAYLAAVEADNDLYDEAWKRHVMFACPSTLLYALRMVSYLWTQEAQAKNVEEIVKRGSELYDKFAGFTADLMAIGVALKKAGDAYDGALNKLSTGQGNAVRQVEMLRELGVKPSKRIAQPLLDRTGSAKIEALELSEAPSDTGADVLDLDRTSK